MTIYREEKLVHFFVCAFKSNCGSRGADHKHLLTRVNREEAGSEDVTSNKRPCCHLRTQPPAHAGAGVTLWHVRV